MPAADGIARDHGDHRLGQIADLALQLQHVQPGHTILADIAAVAAHSLVAAGAKGLIARPGEDNHPDAPVLMRPLESVGQFKQRLGPEGIAHFRAVDRNFADALGIFVQNIRVFMHGFPLDRHIELLLCVKLYHTAAKNSRTSRLKTAGCSRWTAWPARCTSTTSL